MPKKKRLLRKISYIAIGFSVSLNILFVASIVLPLDFNKKFTSLITHLNRMISQVNSHPGRWHTLDNKFDKNTLSAEQKEKIKQLESLGYLSGSRPAPKSKNILNYNKDLAYKGLNLYTSGHAPEAILTDMQGNELHKWHYDFEQIWPNFKPSFKSFNDHQFWRRAYLFENGDLLAIFEGFGLIKLDKHSQLLWVSQGKAHHDLHVDQNSNNIYVLTRRAVINPKYNKKEPILEDYISILDPKGIEIKRVSILKCLENSRYDQILYNLEKEGDILHTNTIELLDGKLAQSSPAFREGNVLISILYPDLICVIDLDSQAVVWALSGLWRKQHQPTILENGNMLIFDNLGNNGKSRVIEFDPFSQEVFWAYDGSPEAPLFSYSCGSCERLPNGNILISESDAGRALEITPRGTIVWEFLNPHRAGENNELIATLFEVVRLEPDFPLGWLEEDN